MVEEHKHAETLRVMKIIRNRSYMKVEKSQDVLPSLDSRKVRELSKFKKDLVLINFDQKATERLIDVKNLVHSYSADDFSLKIDSLECTIKKI